MIAVIVSLVAVLGRRFAADVKKVLGRRFAAD